MADYFQQKQNIDLLRHRVRYPIAHNSNIPSKVDLRRYMTDIEDQGDMGSCVANAIAGSLEYLIRRRTGKKIDVSRLFIDFNARVCNVDWGVLTSIIVNVNDPGTSFSTNRKAALRGLQQYGFCEEKTWPYTMKLFTRHPSKQAYKEAARNSIIPLKVPINVDSIRTCVANGIPVLVGIILSTDEAAHNQGWIKVPEIPPPEGFHACLVVGYDDKIQHFIIRNSWGTDWGDKGYCYVPYKYLIDKRLVAKHDAFWAIADIIHRDKRRVGYVSYPNFTQYHLRNMVPVTTKNHQYPHPRDQYRREKTKYP